MKYAIYILVSLALLAVGAAPVVGIGVLVWLACRVPTNGGHAATRAEVVRGAR